MGVDARKPTQGVESNMMWLIKYIERQKAWSEKTFGPGRRTIAISKHIRKELEEIEADPGDRKEWIDVIILGIEGFWRSGGTAGELPLDLLSKQVVNFNREWNRTGEDEPSEHIR